MHCLQSCIDACYVKIILQHCECIPNGLFVSLHNALVGIDHYRQGGHNFSLCYSTDNGERNLLPSWIYLIKNCWSSVKKRLNNYITHEMMQFILSNPWFQLILISKSPTPTDIFLIPIIKIECDAMTCAGRTMAQWTLLYISGTACLRKRGEYKPLSDCITSCRPGCRYKPGSLLLKWINFNLKMDNSPLYNAGRNYLSIPKLERLHRSSLGMDK